MNYKIFRLKDIFISFIVLLIFSIALFPLITASVLLTVKASFLINIIFVVFLIYRHLLNNSVNFIHGNILIFIFLFYILAPIIQLSNNNFLWINTLPVIINDILKANLVILLFIISYYIFSISFQYKSNKNQTKLRKKPSLTLLLFFLTISSFISLLALKDVINSISLISILNEELNSSEVVIKGKILYMIPFISLVYTSNFLKNNSKAPFYIYLIILILFIEVLICKNPLLDRRNSLGPIYLSLIVLFFFKKDKLNNISYFIFNFVVMVVMFPLSALLTHVSFEKWGEFKDGFNFGEFIKGHFTNLHYDAYPNIIATFKYVNQYDFQLGNQLLGSLLFFIPRSYWPNKPISTGELIGDYLMSFNYLWFNNISATFVAEAWIDFGIVGIILFSFLLSLLVKKANIYFLTDNSFHYIFGLYSTFFVFFLMRGALLPAVAYLTGAVISILILTKYSEIFIDLINKIKISWKTKI